MSVYTMESVMAYYNVDPGCPIHGHLVAGSTQEDVKPPRKLLEAFTPDSLFNEINTPTCQFITLPEDHLHEADDSYDELGRQGPSEEVSVDQMPQTIPVLNIRPVPQTIPVLNIRPLSDPVLDNHPPREKGESDEISLDGDNADRKPAIMELTEGYSFPADPMHLPSPTAEPVQMNTSPRECVSVDNVSSQLSSSKQDDLDTNFTSIRLRRRTISTSNIGIKNITITDNMPPEGHIKDDKDDEEPAQPAPSVDNSKMVGTSRLEDPHEQSVKPDQYAQPSIKRRSRSMSIQTDPVLPCDLETQRPQDPIDTSCKSEFAQTSPQGNSVEVEMESAQESTAMASKLLSDNHTSRQTAISGQFPPPQTTYPRAELTPATHATIYTTSLAVPPDQVIPADAITTTSKHPIYPASHFMADNQEMAPGHSRNEPSSYDTYYHATGNQRMPCVSNTNTPIHPPASAYFHSGMVNQETASVPAGTNPNQAHDPLQKVTSHSATMNHVMESTSSQNHLVKQPSHSVSISHGMTAGSVVTVVAPHTKQTFSSVPVTHGIVLINSNKNVPDTTTNPIFPSENQGLPAITQMTSHTSAVDPTADTLPMKQIGTKTSLQAGSNQMVDTSFFPVTRSLATPHPNTVSNISTEPTFHPTLEVNQERVPMKNSNNLPFEQEFTPTAVKQGMTAPKQKCSSEPVAYPNVHSIPMVQATTSVHTQTVPFPYAVQSCYNASVNGKMETSQGNTVSNTPVDTSYYSMAGNHTVASVNSRIISNTPMEQTYMSMNPVMANNDPSTFPNPPVNPTFHSPNVNQVVTTVAPTTVPNHTVHYTRVPVHVNQEVASTQTKTAYNPPINPNVYPTHVNQGIMNGYSQTVSNHTAAHTGFYVYGDQADVTQMAATDPSAGHAYYCMNWPQVESQSTYTSAQSVLSSWNQIDKDVGSVKPSTVPALYGGAHLEPMASNQLSEQLANLNPASTQTALSYTDNSIVTGMSSVTRTNVVTPLKQSSTLPVPVGQHSQEVVDITAGHVQPSLWKQSCGDRTMTNAQSTDNENPSVTPDGEDHDPVYHELTTVKSIIDPSSGLAYHPNWSTVQYDHLSDSVTIEMSSNQTTDVPASSTCPDFQSLSVKQPMQDYLSTVSAPPATWKGQSTQNGPVSTKEEDTDTNMLPPFSVFQSLPAYEPCKTAVPHESAAERFADFNFAFPQPDPSGHVVDIEVASIESSDSPPRPTIHETLAKIFPTMAKVNEGRPTYKSKSYRTNKSASIQTPDIRWICQTCGKQLSCRTSFKLHLKIHNGDRPHQCHLCPSKFITANSLRYHLMTHSRDNVFPCPGCDKLFKSEARMQHHVDASTKMPKYSCSDCDRKFRYKCARKCHADVYHKARLKCETCGKSLKNKNTLKVHARVHEGSKPFKCTVCEKGFTSAQNRDVHTRLHYDIRPFKCSVCGKRFYQKAQHTIHMLTHQPSKTVKQEF